MPSHRGGLLTLNPISPSTASATGVWSLKDAMYAQATGDWPYAILNDYESSVAALFESSEAGFWLDPSDTTTLYQDISGLIPVTDVEQPVGLVLDKAHGKPFYGAERIVNGDFSSGTTGWTTGTGATISDGRVNCTNVANFLYQDNAFVVGKRYRVVFDVTFTSGSQLRLSGATQIDGGTQSWSAVTGQKSAVVVATSTTIGIEAQSAEFSGTIDNVSVREFPTFCAFQENNDRRPILSRRHNVLVGTASLATQNVTTVAINYTLAFSGTGSITLSGTASGTLSSGINTFNATAGTLTLTVSGSVTDAQLVPSYKAQLPYQWVVNSSSYDANPNLFPSYLRVIQGSFQNLKTTLITPGTDELQLFAGITTITDGGFAMIAETSPISDSNNGSMFLLAPRSSVGTVLRIRGTVDTDTTTSSSEVNVGRIVYVATSDISASTSKIKRNGEEFSTSSSPGSGNFLPYEAYFFSRAGSSLFFGGECYGIVLRFGSNLTIGQIAAAENFMKSKTGVTY